MNDLILDDKDVILKLAFVIDDLYKSIFPKQISSTNSGRKPTLKTSELITISVIFSISNSNAFKSFYRIFKLTSMFPRMPEYSRLLRNVKAVSHETGIMLKVLMEMTKGSLSEAEVKLLDSTPLPVCGIKREFSYRTSDNTSKGKSSIGWFYGFKLHIVTNSKGNLLNLEISTGSMSDKNHELVLSVLKGLSGIVLADTGYLSGPLTEKLRQEKIIFITGVRKNMKKLITETQHKTLKMRQTIETTLSCIKHRLGCCSSLPRSDLGYIFRYITAAFTFVLISMFF